MADAKPRATERSEGGSDNIRTRRSSERDQRITVRFSKAEMIELERWQTENSFDTIANAVRVLVHRGITKPSSLESESA